MASLWWSTNKVYCYRLNRYNQYLCLWIIFKRLLVLIVTGQNNFYNDQTSKMWTSKYTTLTYVEWWRDSTTTFENDRSTHSPKRVGEGWICWWERWHTSGILQWSFGFCFGSLGQYMYNTHDSMFYVTSKFLFGYLSSLDKVGRTLT